MTVRCRFNRGRDLASHERFPGVLDQSEFDVALGTEYLVYGICVYGGAIGYLLDVLENLQPNWFPAALFSVADPHLGEGWKVAHFSPSDPRGLSAIVGYSALVESAQHFDDLAERRPAALREFASWKKRINVTNGEEAPGK